MEKLYTIGEASRITGLPASTLRYYDKERLLPSMTRSEGGIRMFGEEDFAWIRLIGCLKESGMPLKEIRRYIDLQQEGDSTIEERRQIVHARRDIVEQQLRDLQRTLDFITYKCWYYDVAAEAGTCDAPQNTPPEDMPDDVRRIKESLGFGPYADA